MKTSFLCAGLVLVACALLILAFCLFLPSCVWAPQPVRYQKIPVETTQFDDKLWDLNKRLCLERGGDYLVVWRNLVGTWECSK